MNMLKELRAKARRRKVKKVLRTHASDILVGVAMGVLTDIATNAARKVIRKRLPRKFR